MNMKIKYRVGDVVRLTEDRLSRMNPSSKRKYKFRKAEVLSFRTPESGKIIITIRWLDNNETDTWYHDSLELVERHNVMFKVKPL